MMEGVAPTERFSTVHPSGGTKYSIQPPFRIEFEPPEMYTAINPTQYYFETFDILAGDYHVAVQQTSSTPRVEK